jgi:hypothetical protein
MEEIKKNIEEWISEVSKLRPELGGFAICPYASKSKHKIVKCNVFDIIPEDGYDVLIFVVESELSVDALKNWVSVYNEEYPIWKFFEDSSIQNTYINGIKTNNDHYNLILAQPKEKLKRYREILSKTNYYNYWSNDYLKEILEDDYKILEK